MWFWNIRVEFGRDCEQIKRHVITSKSGTKQARFTPAPCRRPQGRKKGKQLSFTAQICKIKAGIQNKKPWQWITIIIQYNEAYFTTEYKEFIRIIYCRLYAGFKIEGPSSKGTWRSWRKMWRSHRVWPFQTLGAANPCPLDPIWASRERVLCTTLFLPSLTPFYALLPIYFPCR